MNSEIRELLSREITELEEQITHRTAMWQQMKDKHDLHWAHRHAENDPNEELECEQRSNIREYYTMYIAPLEEQLAEKRRTLALFD